MVDPAPHKALLKTAQDHILALQQKNQALQNDLNTLLQAQTLEADQMVQMSEQVWKLEEALMNETSDKETALVMLRSLKTNMDRIKTFATDTLLAVKQNKATRLAMAAQIFEIKSIVETLSLTKE